VLTDGDICVGFEFLPKQIVDYLQRSLNARPPIPHVYHVTQLTYCLKKEYYKRKYPELNGFNISSQYNILNGNLLDKAFTPLFAVNQRAFVVHKNNVSITGTLDFVCVDEETGEKALYDLKRPKSTYFKETEGSGQGYRKQVQCYLALAHANGELLDVHKAYVLMCAENIVREEVAPDPEILEWMLNRAFLLDSALEHNYPSLVSGPEESWECLNGFCPFRKHCGKES